MGSMSEEEDPYFDSRDDITSVSDSGSDCPDNTDSDYGVVDSFPASVGYEVWIKNPVSIRERRNKFLRWMGLGEKKIVGEDPEITSSDELEVDTDRITEYSYSGAVLGSSRFDDRFSSSHSSMSCRSTDARELLDRAFEENFNCRIRNLDDGTEFIVDEMGEDGMLTRLRKVGSDSLLTVQEFERSLGLSPLVQQMMRREVEQTSNLEVARKQVKKGWLRRIGVVACIVDRQVEAGTVNCNDSYPVARSRNQTVKVRSYKKRSKELSALYMKQDIQAHEGSILAMKFSHEGQYLASAGEDGIVRVWQVMESERSDEFDILCSDPSCAYFRINYLREVVPLHVEKNGKLKNTRKTSDSSCVIFPKKLFQILDKPIHEFHGHCGAVLDLSWSKNKLLSSSMDKTVRLWQVGYNQCLKIFSHNNYVTSVQFNPVDDNYFISGSIDGKVRIWAISGCQVVDWTDITEIVTAVCYRPDGKGGIIGSMNGDCRFYDASDNRLQLYAQICLQGKKKSPLKRITGFQFSPTDPSKLLVTSADSQVRVLCGVDVICKYRGLQNAGSQASACFTSDGSHIVSAGEDSNVYIWNNSSNDGPVAQAKNHWSCERFFSNNASVAVPWCRMTCSQYCLSSSTSGASASPDPHFNAQRYDQERGSQQYELVEDSLQNMRFSSSSPLSLSHRFFSEPLVLKGSATWPEEKLPPPSSLSVSSAMCKSQFKLLKSSCQSMNGCPHAWGMVIVTAGWDGRIRAFQNYGLPIRL
ncbi:uncharacterized protein LOC107423670 isoform X2 [Ziziphus jujuba]|uniref:Uncharacterized protein LOC107423670 isoform X2 n=1 Tax=Ziziphus jujuba TaxID=326968 RepID=A0ABM3IT30_ZIZJJ|nr:uncharacterized protein LOC107423670 isoform X2 [Ziziphus jujuba]